MVYVSVSVFDLCIIWIVFRSVFGLFVVQCVFVSMFGLCGIWFVCGAAYV